MGPARSGCFAIVMVVVSGCTFISAEPEPDVGPPARSRLLVQSELDFLTSAERLVTLQIVKAQPATLVEMLRKESGLTIEIRGTLPSRPLLSASFRDAPAKDVLKWFGKQVPVTFRVEAPNKLWIITEVPRDHHGAKEAS